MFRKIIIMMIVAFNLSFINLEGAESFKIEEVDYHSFILGDVNGEVFLGENEDVLYPLASVTKLMTMMVVYDAINNGEISKLDIIKIDREVARVRGSRIWMTEGQKISVSNLLKATSIHSANNAAYALAKYVGRGNIENFVNRMRSKTKELGLENELDFNTPTGLPSDMTGKKPDMGSARGMYKLGIEALKYKDLVDVASIKQTTIHSGMKIKNRNKLLGKQGIFGLKTGHYDAAGFNLVIASEKDGMEIVYVILGGKSEKMRDNKILADITKFYNENEFRDILRSERPVENIELSSGSLRNLEVYPDRSYGRILKKGREVVVMKTYALGHPPFTVGRIVGSYNLLIDGEVVKTGKLVLRENSYDEIRDFKRLEI